MLLYVYWYLSAKHNTRLALDPSYPYINGSQLLKCGWKEFYGYVKEDISPDAPEICGKEVDLSLYVNSDNAGDKGTWRSRTEFMIYMNKASTQRLSKKLPTIETSVFGAKFVAAKIGMETLRGLTNKISVMSIP